MASVLDSHVAEIPELCRRYGVARLELFGSAAGDGFDPQRSDLDFLVEFDADSSRLFDRYFGLKESLEALYGRPVDLVAAGSLQNPYFIEAVNKTRRVVYAAEDPPSCLRTSGTPRPSFARSRPARRWSTTGANGC